MLWLPAHTFFMHQTSRRTYSRSRVAPNPDRSLFLCQRWNMSRMMTGDREASNIAPRKRLVARCSDLSCPGVLVTRIWLDKYTRCSRTILFSIDEPTRNAGGHS